MNVHVCLSDVASVQSRDHTLRREIAREVYKKKIQIIILWHTTVWNRLNFKFSNCRMYCQRFRPHSAAMRRIKIGIPFALCHIIYCVHTMGKTPIASIERFHIFINEHRAENIYFSTFMVKLGSYGDHNNAVKYWCVA